MMQSKAPLAAIVLALLPLAATAQEFTGATIGVETFLLTDDFDIGTTAYTGAAEANVWGGIGLAANATYYGFTALDSDARNLTLHGLYDLGGITGGAFYSIDDSDAGTNNIYGIQGAMDFGAANAAAYIGYLDGDSGNGALLGADASYGLSSTISGTASFAFAQVEDIDQSRLSAGGTYAITDSLELFGDISSLSVSDDVDTNRQLAIGLGARLVLGPERGTTFGSRSVFDVALGF